VINTFLYSFLALLPLGGLTYEHFAALRDKAACSPPGELISVGTHQLHIHCQGKAQPSSPTVILESGIWGSSLDWQLVQSSIAPFAQVCSYDRAGYGWSDKGPGPRSFDRLVNELKALLMTKGIKPPYIFVGHSLGGALVRYYHALYPDEVAGIVLVDSVSEYEPPQFSSAFWGVSKALAALAPFGILRGLSKVIPSLSSNQEWIAIRKEKYLACHCLKLQSLKTCFDESNTLDSGLTLLARTKKTLYDRPLVIISRGRPRLSQEKHEKMHEEHLEAQKKLLSESSYSRLIIAENSGHWINIDQPEIIIEVVKSMINESDMKLSL
jgi:pimeloyl-ACP methyl ester carboxylesterase